MAKKQHYMTEKERYQLEAYLRVGKGVSWIALEMGFSRQTIYNEIQRGSYIHTCKYWDERRYSAAKGQDIFEKRQRRKGRPEKLRQGSDFMNYLEGKLIGLQEDGRISKKRRYSPAAALAAARSAGFTEYICINTLYNYIHRGHMGRAKAHTLWEAPYRRKRSSDTESQRIAHPKLPSIEIRPEHINQRAEPGHKEMDLVVSGKKGRSALLTMTDRLTRQEVIRKLPDKKAESVVKALRSIRRNEKLRSITTDNGSEFMSYKEMRRSVPEIYYCHSYAAWEKGTNENHNRMIRRWYPKGTNFDLVKTKDLKELQEWMNNYPRKSLGWMTPNEAAEAMRGM